MIALIGSDLFSPHQVRPLDLLALLQLGAEERHIVALAPSDDDTLEAIGALPEPVMNWLDKQSPRLREEIELVLNHGELRIAEAPAGMRRLLVTHAPSSRWDTDPAELTLDDALSMLRSPLKVLLENRRNDWSFLQRMLPADGRREMIVRAHRARWLEVVQGGGIGEVCEHVKALDADSREVWRYWVMFDSDALEPASPSSQATNVDKACEQRDVQRHMLKRRAAENYLPSPALRLWAHQSSRRSRRKIVEAFEALNHDQRAHFNMKKGLQGDARRRASIWRDLEAWKEDRLRACFDDNINDLFSDGRFDDAWMDDEDTNKERNAIAGAIMEML